MKLKINILTSADYPTFSHEFDEKKYGSVYDVHENCYDQDIVWDIILVYENIKHPVCLKHHKGGLLFCSGEPPLSRVYPQQFVNQFNVFRTTHRHISHPNVINSHIALNWHFGLSFKTKNQKYKFEELCNLPCPSKEKLFSVVTSSKKMMPGHNYRQNLIANLRRDFNDYIDFFGDGVNNIEYKCDAILPYKFHICLENTEVEHYWSEKFSDSLLGYAIPIYAGCPNINDYFDRKGFYQFSIKNYNQLKEIINGIIQNPDISYQNHYQAMLANRDKLLHQYTIYEVLGEMIKHSDLSGELVETLLLPYQECRNYKWQYRVMQFKRKLLKMYINLSC